MTKTEQILVQTEPELKNRAKEYGEKNGLSLSGAVRLILSQNLPEKEELDSK